MTFIPGYSGPNYWSGNDFRFGYAMPQPVPRPVPQQPQQQPQQSGLLGAMPQGGVTGYQGGLIGEMPQGGPGNGSSSGIGPSSGVSSFGPAMGLIGLASGVPGLGLGLGAAGVGLDVGNANAALSALGYQPNVAFAPAMANQVSLGFAGQSPTAQATNTIGAGYAQAVAADPSMASIDAMNAEVSSLSPGLSPGQVAMSLGMQSDPGMAAVNDTANGGSADAGGDRVICTHMYERGYITRDEIEAERAWARTLPADAIAGYHRWAIPFVAWLSDNDWACPLIAPFVRLWVRGDKSGPFHRLAVGLCRKLAQPAAA